MAINQSMVPKVLFIGKKVDFQKELSLKFGDYFKFSMVQIIPTEVGVFLVLYCNLMRWVHKLL